MRLNSKTRETILVVIIVVLIISTVVAAVIAVYSPWRDTGPSAVEDCPDTGDKENGLTTSSPARNKAFGSSSKGKYKFAAVASEGAVCSKVGTDILGRLGGSATDAAVATMFCLGVVNMDSTGLGGGHFMTIYDTPKGQTDKIVTTLFAREVAPAAATQDMFVNKTGASTLGGLSVGVPGQLSGLYQAWQKFGKVEWRQLVEPSIRICREGFRVDASLGFAIQFRDKQIRADPAMVAKFVKSDGSLVTKGDTLTLPEMADTLERVAADPMGFYTGSLANDIIADLTEHGSIITADDLANYVTKEKAPLKVTLQNGNFTVYSSAPPSSGAVVQYILNILDGLNLTPASAESQHIDQTYHRIAEAFKFAFGKRSALGDADYANVTEILDNLESDDYARATMLKINDTYTQDLSFYEPNFEILDDHGTSHLSILAPDGSAVAVTGTINLPLGGMTWGRRTGIFFNNEMDDFSTPGTVNFFGVPSSPSNYIEPGKMPMSSMSPTLILDQEGNVVLVIGASGGTRIISSIATVVAGNLWMGLDLEEAVDTPRLHHQLLPNTLSIENHADPNLIAALRTYGHEVTIEIPIPSSVQAIRSTCWACHNITCAWVPCIQAVSDSVKDGVPDGF